MTDSNIVELYEEMLYERAAKGIRPVLYVSSRKDFECSILLLLDEPPEGRLSKEHRTAAIGFGQHAMPN
jgi:hypothetical protein